MYSVIFDLEATCNDRNIEPNFDNEIIEIGCVKVTEKGEVVDKLTLLVKPTRSIVTPYCTKLTTITKNLLNKEGIEFKDAYSKFEAFCEDSENVFSWGFYDNKQLRKDCKINKINCDAVISKHRNLKEEHKDLFNLKRGIGVSKALNKANLSFDGTQHRGIDDALNIAKIYKHMVETKDFK